MANLKIIETQRKLNISAIGIKGNAGVGIQSAEITSNNELLLTLTDNSIISAGFINISAISTQTIQDDFISGNGQSQFVLSNSTQKAIITVNGVQQKNNIDYTITGNLLNFNYGLEEFDDVIATYWV